MFVKNTHLWINDKSQPNGQFPNSLSSKRALPLASFWFYQENHHVSPILLTNTWTSGYHHNFNAWTLSFDYHSQENRGNKHHPSGTAEKWIETVIDPTHPLLTNTYAITSHNCYHGHLLVQVNVRNTHSNKTKQLICLYNRTSEPSRNNLSAKNNMNY